jgi:hypothetical protein
MNDAKPEVLFKGIEIAVPMKEGVAVKTKGRDEAIHRLTYSVAQGAQRPLISGCRHGQLRPSGREDFKVLKLALHSSESSLLADAAEYFA